MRAAAVGGLCLLVLALVGGGSVLGAVPAGPATGGTGPPPAGPGPAAAADPVTTPTPTANDSRTQLVIDLRANGNAQWTVATFVPIESASDRRAFEDLAADFTAGEADVGPSVDLFRSYAAATETATGREMAIRAVSVNRTAYATNDTGVLVLRFTWLNFARVQGDRVIVDDAFRTPDGTWLPRLRDGQTLIIRPPKGYLPTTAPAPITNGTITFQGPVTFEPGELSITFERSQVTPTDTTSPPPTSPPTTSASPTPGGPDDDREGLDPLLLGILLVGAIVVAYFILARGDIEVPFGGVPGTGGAGGGGGSGGDAGGTEAAGGSSADPEAGAASEPESAPEPTPEAPFAGVDVELLSDEERVTRLLEANGGRMKQATIVKETGWSNAKVSQLLSSMDEADRIDKLRIGRENLISLPDQDLGGDGES